MKPTPVLLACLTAAAATSAGVSLLFVQPATRAAEEAPMVSPDLLRDLSETLERMQAEQEQLAEVVRELEMRPGAALGERVAVADIDAAVARYLADQSGLTQVAAAAVETPEAAARTAKDDFDELISGDWDSQSMQEIWQRAREEGRIDELVALFEERVEEDPNDPERRLELGQAYLEKIQEVGQGPLAGVYATRADEAFDAALEIDPAHWGARFNKAVALSFWPPIFGKQSAAIQQFEMLIAQQSGMTPSASHAQTHLLLGNLYQQLGDRDKAIEAWRQGSSLYPDFDDLRSQLELAGAQ